MRKSPGFDVGPYDPRGCASKRRLVGSAVERVGGRRGDGTVFEDDPKPESLPEKRVAAELCELNIALRKGMKRYEQAEWRQVESVMSAIVQRGPCPARARGSLGQPTDQRQRRD